MHTDSQRYTSTGHPVTVRRLGGGPVPLVVETPRAAPGRTRTAAPRVTTALIGLIALYIILHVLRAVAA